MTYVSHFIFVEQEKLVSVVMCFLNGAAWIGEAIESVLIQNYAGWELILVDDGSTDGATDIARNYASRNPGKIRYTEHPGHVNRGLTLSRNTGISLAKGEWIAFLDADDCWFPGKLSADLRLFTLNPEAAMICQASQFWYSWLDENQPDVYTAVGVESDRLYPPLSLTEKLYPLGAGAPPCPSGIIIRTGALKRNGGFEESFRGEFGLYEDQAFLAKIYLNEKVYISGKANNLYRKHAGSMTDSLSDAALYARVRLFFLYWLEQYLESRPEIPGRIWELVKKAEKELDEKRPSAISRE